MTLLMKAVRLAVVAGAWGAAAYWVYQRVRPEPIDALTAAPYPAPGAHAEPMPADPPGPMEPVLAGVPTLDAAFDPELVAVE